MATKWYLRATALNTFPTSGEKSTTEPVGSQTYGLTPADLDLSATKGSSATSAATTLPNSTTANNGTLGRWSSGPLVGGTYGSGTWTIAIQTAESDANYNVFWRTASIYFWRPNNSSVVGFVVDSNTQTGVEFGNGTANTRYGQVISWTGANVTITDGDILVFEAWTGGTPSMAGAGRTATIYYDGTTDVTAAYSGTDPASYIQAPADLPPLRSLAVGTGVTGNLRTASSAKASLSKLVSGFQVARAAVGKLATASSAKAALVEAKRLNAKAATASSAKASLRVARPVIAKSATASGAKATFLARVRPLVAKAATAAGLTATLRRARPLVTKLATASGTTASLTITAGGGTVSFAAKVPVSSSAKASAGRAVPIATTIPTSSSAAGTRLARTRPLTAKSASATGITAALTGARSFAVKVPSSSAGTSVLRRQCAVAVNLAIAMTIADATLDSSVFRDVDYLVGAVLTGWRAAAPETGWVADATTTGWANAAPETGWDADQPSTGWKAGVSVT